MPKSWFADPEVMSTTFSISFVSNNLSRHDNIMAYAHMDDVVYVNSSQTPYATHKLPVQEKSFVHQTRICHLQGMLYVVVASDTGVQIFDAKGEKLVYELVLKDTVTATDDGSALFCRGIGAIDSDRPSIVVGSSTGSVFVLGKERLSKGTPDHEFDLLETLSDHKEPVQCVDSSPGGALLATSDDTGTIIIRSPDDSFEITNRIPGEAFPATSMRFSPDGWLICGYLTGAIRLYKRGSFHLHSEVAAHSRAITAIDIFESHIVSVGEDTFMNVWELGEVKSASRLKLVSSHCVANDLLTGVALTSAKNVITASYDTTHLKMWHPE